MNLIQLVKYFRNNGYLETFQTENEIDSSSEVVEVYMQKPFELKSEIRFFEIEKTQGQIEYILEGMNYNNLFDFFFFQDFIEESKSNLHVNTNDEEIAQKLLDYAIQDA